MGVGKNKGLRCYLDPRKGRGDEVKALLVGKRHPVVALRGKPPKRSDKCRRLGEEEVREGAKKGWTRHCSD